MSNFHSVQHCTWQCVYISPYLVSYEFVKKFDFVNFLLTCTLPKASQSGTWPGYWDKIGGKTKLRCF